MRSILSEATKTTTKSTLLSTLFHLSSFVVQWLIPQSNGQMLAVELPEYSIREPSYLIVAPRVVRPAELVSISCTIMNKKWSLVIVKAHIYNDEAEVASSSEELVSVHAPVLLGLRMPLNARSGYNYFLHVEGRLDGELLFVNKSELVFQQKAVSVIIQLDRPDYRHETYVRFRCIAVYPDLTPYTGTMDVFIIGPKGIIFRRWENRQTTMGVVSLEYELNDAPPAGRWRVRANVIGHDTDKLFDVYEFYQWKYEVNVSMPHYFLTTAPGISGVVVANYTTGRAVFGRCRVIAKVKEAEATRRMIQSYPTVERYYEDFTGVVDFFFPMSELIQLSGRSTLDRMEIYVEAQVEDPYFGDLSNGSFITSLYDPSIRLKFLGKQPKAFKPKAPYTTYVAVSQQDGTQLPLSRIRNANVRFTVEMNGASSASNQSFVPIGPNSIAAFTFIPDPFTQFIAITATFVEADYEDPNTRVVERAVRYNSPSYSYIYVTSSTVQPQVGDYMIFTVKVSQPVDVVYYHIVSSSRIIFTDVLAMNNKQKTFDVGLTRDMAPSAHIVAYYIRYDGEIVADSYNFHVNASSVQNKVNMTINKRKDFTGDTIEILAYASPQSFVGFAALDESIVRLYKGGNIITELMLYDELYSFDSYANTSHQQTWNSEWGYPSERVFFPSNSYAYDATSTFAYSGLILFTDLPVYDTLVQYDSLCDASLGLAACLDGRTCFNRSEHACDGVCQCSLDCADESNCEEPVEFFRPLSERFFPKIERLYQLAWLWQDKISLPDGRVQFTADVNKDIANYEVNAFAISHMSGLGLLQQPQRISTTRQFWIRVEMSNEARLGEQMGIRVDAFNFQQQRIEALIVLLPSSDYRFVNVEPDGIVSSYEPKATTGQHQVLVIIQPGTSRRIHIPVLFIRAGMIEVKLEAISGANRDDFTTLVQVQYEGVTNVYHTPYLLSLVNTPRLISEFEIVTNETFILPLQQTWSYVPGSVVGQVFINGDLCGPFFLEGYEAKPNADVYLKISYSSDEAGVFHFGTMLYGLIYMRQGHGARVFTQADRRMIIELLNYELLRIYVDYESKGYFTNYGVTVSSSIWLTSWAITILKEAVDPVYERDGLFIDPRLLNDTVVWLISQQDPVSGAWNEVGPVYDRKFRPLIAQDENGTQVELHLSLTAQVLIALVTNADVRGVAAMASSSAVSKGRLFLERHLTKINNSFQLSIVTYALHMTNSPLKDIAFQMLNATKYKNNYGVYWSNWPIPEMSTYWPSKSPRTGWKPESNHEAHAVACTSFALLTLLLRAESSDTKYEIMTWLQTQRNHLGGMSSTYDTLIAQKALTLYAVSTGDSIQEFNININLRTSSDAGVDSTSTFTINNTNVAKLQEYNIQNVWGNVEMDGQGTGYALVQMRVAFNVEYPWLLRKPPYEAFNMTLRTVMYGRNFSDIDYHVCLNWLPRNLEVLRANRSGHVQFDLEIPSGYRAEVRMLKDLYGRVRNLATAEIAAGPRIDFLFDYLDTDPICYSFTITRYIPVANISRYYEMKVYEYHEPGNANRSMYTLRDLNLLDICEVCGSYQCPYCPYYAFGVRTASHVSPMLVLCAALVGFLLIRADATSSASLV